MTTLKIGLVMTGAISAASYTAGVLDYLLDALNTWDAKKKLHREAGDKLEDWTVPNHDISIEIISGTSAGALCAGLLAVTLGRKFISKSSGEIPSYNKFYDVFVKKSQIDSFLTTDDLVNGECNSLLNSDYITRLANEALQVGDEEMDTYIRPSYISPRLEIVVTNVNLRGISYSIAGNVVINHADNKQFYVSTETDYELERNGAIKLNPRRSNTKVWTEEFRESILASAACPVIFTARKLRKNPIVYHQKNLLIPKMVNRSDTDNQYSLLIEEGKISPSFPELNTDYSFLAIDGGIINNEPIGYARRRLEGDLISNLSNIESQNSIILIIDPFPDNMIPVAEYQCSIGPLSVVSDLIKTVLNHARFKFSEVVLANKSATSRFVIKPSKRLASNIVGMFGGFLTESFREYDYQLGQSNCQTFLRDFFYLDADSSIFDNDKDKFVTIKGDAKVRAIIPLIKARQETQEPFWPKITNDELIRIIKLFGKRIDAIIGVLLLKYIDNFILRKMIIIFWKLFGKKNLLKNIYNIIFRELKMRKEI